MHAMYTALVTTLALSAMAITDNGKYTLIGSILGMTLLAIFKSITFLKIAVVMVMIGVVTDLELHVTSMGDTFPPHVVVLVILGWSLLLAKTKGLV